MYVMIDNYDSFVYNLAAYMRENGQEVGVYRADSISVESIRALQPEGIILSPGPKRPQDATFSRSVLTAFQGQIPVLGICLGHQLIGYTYGAQIRKGSRPMHGKLTRVYHDNTGLFEGIPDAFKATRYHSLLVSGEHLPTSLRITARSEDGVIMGLEHSYLPVYGIQFHPEAVLTEYGHELLANFHRICQTHHLQKAVV